MLIEERYTQSNLYQYDQKYSDRIRVFVKGGRGGNGCHALKRLNHGHAMPDGGDGGKGGDVYIRATSYLTNLYQLRRSHFYGNPGKHGSGNRRNGKDGKDIRHSVPLGTEIYKVFRPDLNSRNKNEEYKQYLVDLNTEGKEFRI